TGKEQKVRIEQSAGLSKEEIERMRREAELHAEEDRRKRELAELRNKADNLAWQIEKLMKEHEDKLSSADREALTRAIEKARNAAKSENAGEIKSAISELEAAAHAFSKTLYERAAAAAGATSTTGSGSSSSAGKKDDDTIDAEFEVK
ncbi:MAG TPA: Hsp70 family protein, partial [Thermogutta sp.]|nr:Hsp70 family protein [Thermogutta sp.]